MTPIDLVLVGQTLLLLLVSSVVIGIIGFGTARWSGADIPNAILRGSAASAGALMIGLALLAALLPAMY